MPPQLQVVHDEVDPAPVPRSRFRPEARPQLWGAGACACVAIAFTSFGYTRALRPVLAGPLAAGFLLWAMSLLVGFATRRGVQYTLTSARLEIERGILGKRVESVELWRVRDVVLDQTLFERVRGAARITLYSSDQVEPKLVVGPVSGGRAMFEHVRDAVATARRAAKVVPLA
jgi:hypothetical protein